MTRADVRAFTTSKVEAGPLKPKTINNILVPLGLILKQAAEDGCTVNSPETGLRRVTSSVSQSTPACAKARSSLCAGQTSTGPVRASTSGSTSSRSTRSQPLE